MLLNQLFHIVTYIPCSLLCYYFAARMLQIEKRWPFMLGMTALHVAVQLLYTAAVTRGVPLADQIKLIVQTGIYLLGCLAFSRERVSRRLAAFAIVYLSTLGGEVGSVIVFSLLGGTVGSHGVANATDTPAVYVFMQVVNFAVLAALLTVSLLIWDRIVRKSSPRVLWHFVPFPLSQVLLISLAAHYATVEGFHAERYVALSLGILVSVAADYFLLRALRAFSERAAWYETLLEQQQSYYDHIASDVEDAARIRHDVRNQLQTAYALMQTGEHDAARSQLDELAAGLSRSAHYCANPVVNALIAVKSGRYREAGVELRCRCTVPETISLPGFVLCSLFSNVLDNSLSASRLSQKPERVVTLSSDVQGGMLTLRCENPYSLEAEQKKPRREGHGLGLEILRDLAARYDGALKVDRTDDIFAVTVWLKLPE